MSRTSPAIKLPLEMALGESFFQRGSGGAGRQLADMDPPLGRLLSNIGSQATGMDLPPGKPFEALGSAIGAPGLGKSINPLAEAAIGSSPLARWLSVARQITDTRPEKTAWDKAMNLGTGLRVSSLSPRKLQYEQQKVLTDLMKESGIGRSYTSPSINRLKLYGMWKQGRISDEQFRRALAVQSYYNKMGEGKRASSPEKLAKLQEYQRM